MKVVIYLLGLACIAASAYCNLYPRQAATSLRSMFQTYQLKYLAAIPAVVAVLFLIVAPAAECPWPFWIVGILAAIEAVVAFVNPQNLYGRLLDWFFNGVSDQAYKVISLVGVIFGTLILTLA